jgi:putative ABC transport system substrate-binding protein
MLDVRRRQFISLLGGAAAASSLSCSLSWPFAARAQQPDRVRRIGVLSAYAETDPLQRGYSGAFQRGLRDFGWINGRNIRVDYRWSAGDVARMRALAAELVGLSPDVILTTNTPTTSAALQETRTIPIVFVTVSDPLGSGFVTSLARPNGNVTGFTTVEGPMAGKWLEMLKEVAPRVARVAFMFNPATASGGGSNFLQAFAAAASSFATNAVPAAVRDEAEIERSIAALGREPGGGLIVMPDITTTLNRDLIVALAARHRLPAVYPYRFFATSGGLLSYGIDLNDLYRQSASYVDRILKGEKPADLPVQGPTKFELVINLKTAKTLGLDVPLHLQQLADEVIE